MTERAVASVETDRFAKLLRIALGSDKDGEIIGAVMALKRTLAAAELDTHWIVDSFERGAAPVVHADDRGRDREDDGDDDGQDDRSKVWFAFHRRHRLSEKERLFVENIAARSGRLTPRQRQWLFDICGRLEGA
jgi:hypothetical protein